MRTSVLRRKVLGWFGLHLVKNAGSRILLAAASVDELSVVEAIPDELLLFDFIGKISHLHLGKSSEDSRID
jgi:hypothetical protein